VILGAGIAGLAAAHTLIHKGFDVKIFERNDIVGGLARSSSGNECPSEYSWRVFSGSQKTGGGYYNNLINLLQQIPNGNNKSVFNNLVPILRGVPTGCDKEMPLGLDFNTIPWKDRLTLINILLQGFFSCSERNADELSTINWSEYLAGHNIDEQTYKMVVRCLGPFLGFDNDKASIYDVNNAAEILFNTNYNPFYKHGDAYVTNAPTNVAWFDPWVQYLTETGVQIYTLATVTDINMINGRIESVNVVMDGKEIEYYADYFISALPVESILGLAKKNAELWNADQMIRNLEPLQKLSRQVQCSMQFYFDKRSFFHRKYSLAYLPNCVWGVIIEPEGTVWQDTFDLEKYCGTEIRDIYSVGVCATDIKGILFNKSFVECTADEIAFEVWYQIQQEPDFGVNVCVEDGSNFQDLFPVYYKLWDSFQFKDGKMDTWEPKFANNTFTKKLRPKTKTNIPNFYFSGAFCDTSVSIYCMEGATESGISAANEILKSENVSFAPIIKTDRAMPYILAIPRAFDYVMFKLNLPPLNKLVGGQTWIILLFFIVIIILIVWYIIKKK
jgi:uncharacterized protein with NAD-binding domain and iron-sulfur cluster